MGTAEFIFSSVFCAQGEAPLPQGLRIAITRDLGTLESGLTLIAKGLKHLLARPLERS